MRVTKPAFACLLILLAGLSCLFSLAGNRLYAQEPLRVAVNLVNVSFTARDQHGLLAGGLVKDDITVLEDAVTQKIAFFSQAPDVPLTLGLVVDVSGSQDHFTSRHSQDLQLFLESVLRPGDRVFLLCFGNHLRLVSDYTGSAGELLTRLKAFQHDGGGHFPELAPDNTRDLGTAFYDAIYSSITEKLSTTTGRRALLVFSDGEDNASAHTLLEAIEAAQAANTQVYTIRYTEKHHGLLTARNKYGISVMDRIAAETGSAAVDAEATDPRSYFQQIADELRFSYELAYYPSDPIRDHTFRKISVRSRQPGLTIRARTGYFAR